MAITLRPPANLPPERILLYGREGTGKTNAVLSIARRIPSARFHVIDTDYSPSYERLLATEFSDVGERGNVEVSLVMPDDWAELIDEVARITSRMTPEDWLVIDSMTPTWGAVQEWYVDKVFGASGWDEYLLDVRQKREKAKAKGAKVKALEPLDGWMDWSVINPTYFRLYKRTLRGNPGHLIYTAEASKLGDNEDRGTRDLYGEIGFKPAGQKKLGHTTQTVLYLSKGRNGWGVTTIMDRGRAELDDEDLENFARDYLQKIAGWKPAKYEEE